MSHDTWFHKVARVGVRPLCRTAIRPNHLTTVRLCAGIAAGALLAVGDPLAMRWGAGVFLFSMILDRADGELARMTGRMSAAGHKYDLYADSFSNVLAFVGLGIGLRGGEWGEIAMVMGLAAGLAVAAVLMMVVKLESLGGERAGEIGAIGGFDPDDALVILPIAIWLGYADTLLAAAAFGAPAFAIGFTILYLLRRGHHRDR